jgi:hypothetical protein
MHRLSLPVAVLLAIFGAGCDRNNMPTAPSAPTVTSRTSPATSPATSGPGQGTITIRELSPSPGASLTVRSCPSGGVTRACANQWRSTIDVEVNREMTNAVLVVRFYDGATLCGLSANVRDVLPADSRVTFDLSAIWLSGDYSLAQPCQLPMRTTRMEVELWSDSSSWSNTLMVRIPGAYTFTAQ